VDQESPGTSQTLVERRNARAITMFVDVETLEIGSRWPDKLQAAIKVPVAW
jgi:hypothetical protein